MQKWLDHLENLKNVILEVIFFEHHEKFLFQFSNITSGFFTAPSHKFSSKFRKSNNVLFARIFHVNISRIYQFKY